MAGDRATAGRGATHSRLLPFRQLVCGVAELVDDGDDLGRGGTGPELDDAAPLLHRDFGAANPWQVRHRVVDEQRATGAVHTLDPERVTTREQNPDHQFDALLAAGVAEENLFIDKVSGKLASRPKLDTMLAKLRAGDEVVVTRLRRIGRSQQHMLDLVRWFGDHAVEFVVLEQGIDTSTPGGRLVSTSWPRSPRTTGR